MRNPNCNNYPAICSTEETRVLPLPGGAGLVLCRLHYAAEIAWRTKRNRELAADAQYPLPKWDELEVHRGS